MIKSFQNNRKGLIIKAMKNKSGLFLAPLCALLLLAGFAFSACKSKPAPASPSLPPPEPSASLIFKGVEAKDTARLNLDFSLGVENPFPFAGRVKIENWQAEINGRKAASGFDLDYPENPSLSPGPASFPLMLKMDVAALAAQGLAPADDYEINLVISLDFSFDSGSPVKAVASALAAFPGVRPPVFSITSIAILKAELINTRFRVGLKIDNPNPFPVELAALSYELYGNSRLWADGTEKNVFKVNGRSSLQGDLFLLMNFINMNRSLLDQIIRLDNVNYRFAGEAQVLSGIEYLPQFKTNFDLSGYSKVYDN
jgi:LEA14-like dessication related protein